MSERYFREALDILGFEYDVYDVEVPSGSTTQSNGPDSSAARRGTTQGVVSQPEYVSSDGRFTHQTQ